MRQVVSKVGLDEWILHGQRGVTVTGRSLHFRTGPWNSPGGGPEGGERGVAGGRGVPAAPEGPEPKAVRLGPVAAWRSFAAIVATRVRTDKQKA